MPKCGIGAQCSLVTPCGERSFGTLARVHINFRAKSERPSSINLKDIAKIQKLGTQTPIGVMLDKAPLDYQGRLSLRPFRIGVFNSNHRPTMHRLDTDIKDIEKFPPNLAGGPSPQTTP